MTSYRFTEMLLGLLGITFAVWLVLFDSYNLSPVLAPLRFWGIPEWFMVGVPGLAGLCLLILPRRYRRPIHLLMCPFWIFVSLSIANTNVALTAIPVYATVGLIHAGEYALLAHD